MDDRLIGLVPRPRSVRAKPGRLSLTAEPTVLPTGTSSQQAAAAVRHLLTTLPWPNHPGAIATGDGSTATAARCTVAIDANLGAEAYRLRIDPSGIAIVAGDTAGAIYAAQTLRQLLPDDAWRAAPLLTTPPSTAPPSTTPLPTAPPPTTDWWLPCAEIDDQPALAWRGAHIDVARHFFAKRDLLAVIDALAALKLNRLHLHLTDDQGWRIESRLHPRLHEVGSHRARTRISVNDEQPKIYEDIPHGGYYTLSDLAEIAAFAAQRAMTLVPEIDVPGHSTALLAALPELGSGAPPPGGYQVSPDWGIFPYLLAPLPETMKVLRDVFGELIGATGVRFVHIGGDECVLDRWRNDPRIDASMRDRGLARAEDLHAAFLREIADMLAEDFAARAVLWDEGFVSSGGRPGTLRTDTVVMAWRGMTIARQAAEAGHDVVATPVFPTYFDYYQERGDSEPAAIGGPIRLADVAAFAPVPADWPEQARSQMIGTQFQVWTEYIPDARALDYMIFPRACALAEVAWSGGPVAVADGPGSPDSADSPDGPASADGGPDQRALQQRIDAHLRRLDAAGIGYRPLAGPRPSQQGGTGPRRHRQGYRIKDVAAHLGQLAGEQRP